MVVHFLQHSYTQMFQYSKNDMEHVGINMGVCPVNLYISLILIYIMGGVNNPNGTESGVKESVFDGSAIHLLNGFPSLPSLFVTASADLWLTFLTNCACVCAGMCV